MGGLAYLKKQRLQIVEAESFDDDESEGRRGSIGH